MEQWDLLFLTLGDFVKSPDAVLHFIPPFDKLRAGYLPLMVSLSNHARLACGAFYEAVEFGLFFDFLRVHHAYIVEDDLYLGNGGL